MIPTLLTIFVILIICFILFISKKNKKLALISKSNSNSNLIGETAISINFYNNKDTDGFYNGRIKIHQSILTSRSKYPIQSNQKVRIINRIGSVYEVIKSDIT